MKATFLPTRRANRWLLVSVVVLVSGLGGLLAACSGSETSTTLAGATVTSATAPSTTSSTTLPSTTSTTLTDAAAVARTGALEEAFSAAWDAKDPDALSSMNADEIKSYDANLVGMVITKQDIDGMLYDTNWWGGFEIGPMTSYFVSGDGRFAARMSMFAARDKSGTLRPQPGASLHAFANEKFVWVYDYYGGVLTESVHTEPVPLSSPSAVELGSPATQTAIAEATATIDMWLAAYNGRDAEAFLSAYAEEATYTDVVSPDWRVMTKSELAADVASHFPRAEFQSKLEASPGSPMGAFFVSADGRNAAVQGNYKDRGTNGAKPMLVILELQDGKIVQQYNYISMDRALLQP